MFRRVRSGQFQYLGNLFYYFTKNSDSIQWNLENLVAFDPGVSIKTKTNSFCHDFFYPDQFGAYYSEELLFLLKNEVYNLMDFEVPLKQPMLVPWLYNPFAFVLFTLTIVIVLSKQSFFPRSRIEKELTDNSTISH